MELWENRANYLQLNCVGHQLVQPWTNGAKSRAPGLEILMAEKESGWWGWEGVGGSSLKTREASSLATMDLELKKKLSSGGGGAL